MNNLDGWERLSHPSGSWKVLQEVIGPITPLVAEHQLDPVPDDILHCLTQHQSQEETLQAATPEQWQAYALQQGWDPATLEQLAYYAQYGGYASVSASTAQHMHQMNTRYEQYEHYPQFEGNYGQQLFSGFGNYASQAMQQSGSRLAPAAPNMQPSQQPGHAPAQHWPAQNQQAQAASVSTAQQAGAEQRPMTLLERAGSSIAFPKQNEAPIGQEPVDVRVDEKANIEPEQSMAGRRQPGQSAAAAAQQALRHGPDQHVSTCNLVTTATGWDAPYNQAAAAAAARAAAAYAATEQAGMLVEGHYGMNEAGYPHYGPGAASNWQHH